MIISFCGNALAADITPYLRVGTIHFRENGISEGHKSLIALGLEAKKDFTDRFAGKAVVGWWFMGEPLDEDTELPKAGWEANIQANYKLRAGRVTISPFAALGAERWERCSEGNSKHANTWSHVRFLKATFGIEAEYNLLYARAGVVLPFMARVSGGEKPDSELGFDAETGVRWKGWVLAALYRRVKFDEFGPDGNRYPGFEFNRYGLRLGFTF